ncbi:acyl-CoA dehydrogenase family protein [Caldiplasma sukawensis]
MKLDFSKIFLSRGKNYYSDDLPLMKLIEFLGIKKSDKLEKIGRYVSEEVIEDSLFIDHYGKPVLQTWSVTDERIDGVWISSSHRKMIEKLLDLDVVRSVGDTHLMEHFISGYLISDSGLFCTLTLTAQTLYALKKYGNERTAVYLQKFMNENYLGATYYTEIQGGSDLGANKTIAYEKDGKFILNGENKYFASDAGLADGAIVTAKIKGDDRGVKSICTFYVPAINDDGTPNYEIRRLKDKLGTILVPTGEVVLKDSTGYLIGDVKNGLYIALEILEISRIDDAFAAAGNARKALWESVLYASKRKSFGKKLMEHPLLMRDLMEMEAETEAATLISMLAAKAFAHCYDERPPYSDNYNYARVLTHIAKNMASISADNVTRYAMEIFGGKGFLHEFPVEKFHRDAIVTSIWEGTSNIQALDMIEILIKGSVHKKIFEDLIYVTENIELPFRNELKGLIEKAKKRIDSYLASEKREFFAKDILTLLGRLITLIYMYEAGIRTDSDILKRSADIYYHMHFTDGFPENFEFLDNFEIISWMLK